MDNIMLVKKTTKILPPFEIPLPPAATFFSIAKIYFTFLFNYGLVWGFEESTGKKGRRRKEKEKGKSAKVQKIKRFSSHCCLLF